MRRRLADDVGADARIARQVEINGLGAAQGISLIRRIAAGFQNTERREAVQRTGVQMGEAKMGSQLLGQRALAGGGGAVHRDDDAGSFLAHGVSITAPRPFIKS